MPPAVCAFELPADDTRRAARFYRSAFGWEAPAAPAPGFPEYRRLPAAESGPAGEAAISGGLVGRSETVPAPLVVIHVPAPLEAWLDRVRHAGGVVAMPPVGAGGGRFATFRDTEGNLLGLWEVTPAKDSAPG